MSVADAKEIHQPSDLGAWVTSGPSSGDSLLSCFRRIDGLIASYILRSGLIRQLFALLSQSIAFEPKLAPIPVTPPNVLSDPSIKQRSDTDPSNGASLLMFPGNATVEEQPVPFSGTPSSPAGPVNAERPGSNFMFPEGHGGRLYIKFNHYKDKIDSDEGYACLFVLPFPSLLSTVETRDFSIHSRTSID
ncbi:MAG: hypothetical protein Q9220_001204 [cf. Caloplaca sp. 1 TL-2023]